MGPIRTKGRARQKAFTLARRAGAELKAVVFSKKEAEKAIGYPLKGKICTKKDTAWGRAFQSSKVIWLCLPTSISTIAEEVMHLVTTTSHTLPSFKNRVVALSRGMAPAKARVGNYLVTETITWRVLELTAHSAKEHCRRGVVVKRNLSARKENT